MSYKDCVKRHEVVAAKRLHAIVGGSGVMNNIEAMDLREGSEMSLGVARLFEPFRKRDAKKETECVEEDISQWFGLK